MFKYILNRLTERSTWLGVIALATACGDTIEATFLLFKLRIFNELHVM